MDIMVMSDQLAPINTVTYDSSNDICPFTHNQNHIIGHKNPFILHAGLIKTCFTIGHTTHYLHVHFPYNSNKNKWMTDSLLLITVCHFLTSLRPKYAKQPEVLKRLPFLSPPAV